MGKLALGFLSIIGDKLAKWKSTTFSRKLCNTLAAVLVFLTCVSFPFIGCRMYLSVALITALGFFVGLGSFVALEPNAVDLSPK